MLKQLLQSLNRTHSSGPLPFRNVYITLDDNAAYGFNIDEAAELRDIVSHLQEPTGSWVRKRASDSIVAPSASSAPVVVPNGTVRIYPGADEVGLALLSKLVADQTKPEASPIHGNRATDGSFTATTSNIIHNDNHSSSSNNNNNNNNVTCTLVVWRNSSTTNAVPNYEGQPVKLTVHQQILAAGSFPVDFNADNIREEGDNVAVAVAAAVAQDACPVVLLVNNFDNPTGQLEASQQPFATGRPASDYAAFLPFLTGRLVAWVVCLTSVMADERSRRLSLHPHSSHRHRPMWFACALYVLQEDSFRPTTPLPAAALLLCSDLRMFVTATEATLRSSNGFERCQVASGRPWTRTNETRTSTISCWLVVASLVVAALRSWEGFGLRTLDGIRTATAWGL